MATKPGGGYIDNLPDSAAGSGYYELDETCDEYLAFHYPDGDPLGDLLGTAAPARDERLPHGLRSLWQPRPDGLALDVGAAAGRVTFDLARDHRAAWGIDFSHALMRSAHAVRASGKARYRTVVEGDLKALHDVPVETAANARFAVADALALPFPDAGFDTVVAINLIDRVPDPDRVLHELGRVTRPGGLLIVASPYTWLDTFTPKERWLGGFESGGAAVRGADAVRARLAPAFTIESERRMPFFIVHHARSGQLGSAFIQTFRRET